MPESLLLHGDCLDRLRALPDASVHACVTDPPYDLVSIVKRFGKADAAPAKSTHTGVYTRSSRGFMGQTWDATGIAFRPDVWREVYRVLRPGGYLLAFGGTRTYHRMAAAVEDAGFDVRDCLMWIYGSGFPKSHSAGDGWGSALKPAWEPIVVARTPLDGTIAGNMQTHGTGAMNIDGCRVPHADAADFDAHRRMVEAIKARGGSMGHSWKNSSDLSGANDVSTAGRWPANVILACDVNCAGDAHAPGCPVAMLDAQQEGASRYFNVLPIEADDYTPLFYVAKASRRERETGCESLPAQADGARNHHPTLKPVALLRHLVRLVTVRGGVVLDPFMGSGSTGVAAMHEGAHFIGIEREDAYMPIAQARVAHAKGTR
jgi:site-specific DNA-methyltransferase (adenine-specific)